MNPKIRHPIEPSSSVERAPEPRERRVVVDEYVQECGREGDVRDAGTFTAAAEAERREWSWRA